ncbi:DUF7373 family lipoprotein [Nocardia salmonicida]|uniref:DUF7373 family lipoprotein n=1 Tax=Nocardia salmonicida TaxID=53431 RepID=UPI002E29D8D3|nr:hypothetical protein [Nocardia salmonicida]
MHNKNQGSSMPSSRIRVFGCIAATLVAALAATGCGSSTIAAALPGEIDVRTLDTGSYAKATTPLDMRYDYHNDLAGASNLALMRLTDHVVIGPDIDPSIKHGTGSLPFLDAEKATKILANANKPVLERNKMMFGVGAGASDQAADETGKAPPGSKFTTVVVMQFPDEEHAKRAAAEIDETDFAVAADANQRVNLSKYPTAHSHWRPGVPTIGSTLAYGRYVVSLYMGTSEAKLDDLTDLAQKAYAAQLPLLDQIPPLTPAEMLFLPDDPDQMLRRTLNPDGFGSPNIGDQAAFTIRGFLHNVGPQDHWRTVMSEAGVDRYSKSSSMSSVNMLFRARDAAGASVLVSRILERNYPSVATAPPVLPEARCGENPKDDYKTKRFRCAVTYRQYVATVESDQLTDAHQRAAAQYALLANSQ